MGEELTRAAEHALRWAKVILTDLAPARQYTLWVEGAADEGGPHGSADGPYSSAPHIAPGYEEPVRRCALEGEPVTVWLEIQGRAVGAMLDDPAGEEDVVRLAESLQELVLEDECGRPAPPCPGHPHPAVPVVADGLAVWQCPRSPAHFRRPIL